MEQWLNTDELEEAISALEMCAETLGTASSDPYRWRWAVLSLHGAVQGFMVCALRGTNGLAALPKKIEAKWLEAHEKNLPPPEEKLDSFLNLYKKIKGKRMLFYVNSRPLRPSSTQGSSIKKLNMLRNEFTHFLPRTWSLEVSGIPRICLDCLDVIDFLALQCGNILWFRDGLRERTEAAVASARQLLADIERTYEVGA